MNTLTFLLNAENNQRPSSPATWRRRTLLILSLSTLMTTGAATSQVVSDDDSAFAEVIGQIDACMLSEMKETDIPGAALALVVDGELVYERGYGKKQRDQGGAVDADTLFRIGSLQKMMTAAAVMTQVEQGLVELDEPVTQRIPELRFAGWHRAEEISVAHLLTHTAAIPDISAFDCGTEETLSHWVSDLADVRLFAPPGAFWNYSNAGYNLAGLVAERASGVPYQQLVHEHVWEPAGMMATTLSPTEVIAYGNYTFGHEVDPETDESVILAPDSYDCAWSAPDGKGFSTAGDLARWALVMMDAGGAVLAPSSVEAMQGRQVSRHEFPDSDYGLGIDADRYRGIETRSHDGDVLGWSSLLLWAPQERFAVAVLSNGGLYTKPESTAYCALEAVLQPKPEKPADYSTNPATWGRYRGLYRIRHKDGDRELVYVAHVANQLLWVKQAEDSEIEAYPIKQLHLDTFFVDRDGDGKFNPLAEPDITFIKGSTRQGRRTMWLRYRHFVGKRIFRGPTWRHGLE